MKRFSLSILVLLLFTFCACSSLKKSAAENSDNEAPKIQTVVAEKSEQRKQISLKNGPVKSVGPDGEKNRLSKKGKAKYHRKVTPAWAKNATIYEVNLRQYSEAGDFTSFNNHLDRLKEMGVDILWFMPIYPISREKRKGSLGSCYSVADYKGVNPEHGTIEDFKKTVQLAHSKGMKVILDWVADHTGKDNHLIKDHPHWYGERAGKSILSEDVLELNYEEKALWEYQIAAMKYWVEECDIDGFRCDGAGMVPLDFWNEAREELEKVKPVFMLAEGDDPKLHKKAFDMSYSSAFYDMMNSLYKGEKTAHDVATYLERDQTRFGQDAYRLNFISNHDENSQVGTVWERMGKEAPYCMAVLSAVAPGMPLLYTGQEVGLDRRLKSYDKDSVDWSQKDHPMGELYKKLFALKHENPVMANGDFRGRGGNFTVKIDSSNSALLSFQRTYLEVLNESRSANTVTAIFNLSEEEITVDKLPFLVYGQIEYFTGEMLMTRSRFGQESGQNFKLKPWEYRIYVAKN